MPLVNRDFMGTEWIAPCITMVGTVITAWFAYNQKTKDKMTDLKIEKIKEEERIKSKRRSDNSGIIFGELWYILHELGADRVYVVQPHPLGNEEKLSIYYEVKRKGVEPMKPHIQNLPISDVANFNRELVEKQFIYYYDINQQVEDKCAKAILSSYGCKAAIIRRLSDSKHDRNGNIFCEFTRTIEDMDQGMAQKILHEAATNIQFILPKYI